MPSLSITEKLKQRFCSLSEKAIGSNSTIDEELVDAIISGENPDLEYVLSINPDSVIDPERIYKKIVIGLSLALFEPGDIIKIISKYVRGGMWEKWNHGERELFISEIIKPLEEEDEKNTPGYKFGSIEELIELNAWMSPELKNNPQSVRQEIEACKRIIENIDKVEILEGITDNDSGAWRFHMIGSVFEIPTSKIKTYKEFETMYLANFGKFITEALKLPPVWKEFVQIQYRRAEKIAPEDSTAMIEIGIILDFLSGYRKTEDTIEWEKASNLLLDHGEYYLIAGKNMARILQDNNFKTDAGTIGKIMTRKGMKRPGNPAKRIKGRKIPVKSWWIIKEVLDGEDEPGEDEE